ncbi:MAG: hypothetical protein KJ741_01685 [Proteobacteria bacterium]|nr:hypothetical protein [Pseudomonadota bacterium]
MVKIFARFELEQIFSFLDGNYADEFSADNEKPIGILIIYIVRLSQTLYTLLLYFIKKLGQGNQKEGPIENRV